MAEGTYSSRRAARGPGWREEAIAAAADRYRRAKEREPLPPRLDSGLVFTSPSGLPLDLGNFCRREWSPAVEAAGIETPARLYDLRSTFASNALARGLTLHELARAMGTSVRMIERHYGTFVDGAQEAILARLDQPEDGSAEIVWPVTGPQARL